MARTLTALLHIIMPSLAQAYRPELFYMRGPGPKSRAKRGFVTAI